MHNRANFTRYVADNPIEYIVLPVEPNRGAAPAVYSDLDSAARC